MIPASINFLEAGIRACEPPCCRQVFCAVSPVVMVYIVHSNRALSKLHCRNSRRRYGAVLVWRAARRLARLAGGHGVAGGRANRRHC